MDLVPGEGINLLTGQNAQGKTSVLEAVYLVSFGRVLRGSRDVEAIEYDEEGAEVEAELLGSGTKVGMELKHGRRKRATLNGAGLPRASDLIGRLPAVCFWSGDLALAMGEPKDRRLFLDSELSQLYPGYLKQLTIYKKALEHRNALLKRAQDGWVGDAEFEVWEAQLGPAGVALREYRADWLQRVGLRAALAQEQLGVGEKLSLEYVIRDEYGAEMARGLTEGRRRDILRGSTGVGPHRDDVSILVEGQPVKAFGSQGQQRTSVIATKLGVLDVARETLGFAPVLLLDDIFSDLDKGRRERLMEVAMQEGGQVFLTCTEEEQVGGELLDRAKVFRVDSGKVAEK